MMVCKLHPERELLPFQLLLDHMWPREHFSQKCFSLLSLTHIFLLTLYGFFLNGFPFKQISRQAKTCCLCEKEALYLQMPTSLSVVQTFIIFSSMAFLQTFRPLPSSASHPSLSDALPILTAFSNLA